jgi:hypothetical protein
MFLNVYPQVAAAFCKVSGPNASHLSLRSSYAFLRVHSVQFKDLPHSVKFHTNYV